MLLSLPARRAVIPLVLIAVAFVAGSVILVERDVAFTRNEAESEIVALAEAGALTIQLVPAAGMGRYLSDFLRHPAIAMATVYSEGGTRTIRRRAPTYASTPLSRLLPRMDATAVGCRAAAGRTLCLEADIGHYQKRLSALIAPHLVLLGSLGLLLVMTMLFAGWSSGPQLRALTRTLQSVAEENNYTLRAPEAQGAIGELSSAVNTLLEQMQQRDLILRRRTIDLEAVNKELESFSYSVSHDLRSPLASVDGFSQALSEMYADQLDESGREYLGWIREASTQMKDLVDGLLQMSRISRSELNRTRVDLSAVAHSIAKGLMQRNPSRSVEFQIEAAVFVDADERLLHAVLENLMSNAFKFTGKTQHATIAVGSRVEDVRRIYFVRDNGAGFDSTQAAKMFTAFQRLHSTAEFEGTGIGLATVKRIIERHGGAIWADGRPGQGATFSFTLGESPAPRHADEVPQPARA
jgi:signal transduction histidine kinase